MMCASLSWLTSSAGHCAASREAAVICSGSVLLTRGEVAGRAVDVRGYLSFVPVARCQRAGRLEHQGRAAWRGRHVLGAPGYYEDFSGPEGDGAFAFGLAQRYLHLAVQDKEELVGVLVHVPHVVPLEV